MMGNKIHWLVTGVLIVAMLGFSGWYLLSEDREQGMKTAILTESKDSFSERYGETTKEYSPEEMEVTIVREGTQAKMGTVRLNTPLNHYVMAGKDRLVAEFDIEASDDYDNVLSSMELFNVKSGMKPIVKTVWFKEKQSIPYQKSVYAESCAVKETLGNGSEVKECSMIETGTETDYKVSWKSIDLKDGVLSKGNKTIGIFTDVKRGEKVEWIPTLFGSRIDEFATWTESYNTGLGIYYKLDETAGTNAGNALGNATHNLTVVANWTTGKINNAYDTSGTTINSKYDGFMLTQEMTINTWLYVTNVAPSDGRYVFSYSDANLNFGYDTSSDLYAQTNAFGSTTVSCTTLGSLQINSWQMATLTMKNGEQKLYLNGTQICTTSTGAGAFTTATLSLGHLTYEPGRPREAKIDEIGIWNRTLSAGEIIDLYNNGTGITYTSEFNTPPTTPVWNRPINESIIYSTSYFVNWTNSTDADGDTITYLLEIDNNTDFSSIEYRNMSIIETATPTNAWITGVTSGINTARVRANDGTVNSSWAYLTYTQTSPATTTTLNIPVDNINSTIATVTFNCSATDNTANINNITLLIDGLGNYSYNPSATAGSIERTLTLTGSVHNWTCNATGSTTSQPTTRSFTIDPVDMNLNTPLANANYSTQTVVFNCTANSSALMKNITLVIDDVNNYTILSSVYTQSLSRTVSMAEGTHNWTCLAFDMNQFNETATKRYFGVDTIKPGISLVSSNSSFVTAFLPINTTVNWTASDINLVNTWLEYQGVNYTGGSNGSTGQYGLNFKVQYRGSNQLRMYANDSYGWQNFTTANISVHYINETVNYSGSVYSLDSRSFNLTVDFAMELLSGVRASFTHNNTNWTVTEVAVTGNITRFSAVPVMPYVTASTNKTFLWDVIMTQGNGSDLPTRRYSYSNAISFINISYCAGAGGGQVVVFNFSDFDELNLSSLLYDFEGAFTFWGGNRAVNASLTVSMTNASSVLLCMVHPEGSVFTDAHIQYKAPGYDYRDHFLFNQSVANYTQNINFYSLEIALGTGLQIQVQDEADDPYENYYVVIERYYPGSDEFKTVAVGKTDDAGKYYAFLRFYDAWYRFKTYDYDSLASISNKKLISASPLYITISPNVLSSVLVAFGDIGYSLAFNNDTGVFSLIYTSPAGSLSSARFRVVRHNPSVDTVVCDYSSSSSADSFSCNTTKAEGEYMATFSVAHNSQTTEKIVKTLSAIYRGSPAFFNAVYRNGPLLTGLAFIAIVGSSVAFGAVAAVAVSVFALAVFAALGLVSVGYVSVLGVAIVAGILIARMRG